MHKPRHMLAAMVALIGGCVMATMMAAAATFAGQPIIAPDTIDSAATAELVLASGAVEMKSEKPSVSEYIESIEKVPIITLKPIEQVCEINDWGVRECDIVIIRHYAANTHEAYTEVADTGRMF